MPEPAFPADAHAVRVARRVMATPDIVVLELSPAGTGPLPAFQAGAHVELLLPMGTRHYSLCNPPAAVPDLYRIAVQRETAGRGGSCHLAEEVQEGDMLWLRGPRQQFPLAADARHSVLLAGGIGITPMLSMAAALRAAGSPFELHYSGRTLARMAFANQLLARAFGLEASLYADDGDGAPRMELHRVIGPPSPGQHLYVCGPAGLIAAARQVAQERGWPASQVHWEHFAAPPSPQSAMEDRAFVLEIATTGQRITVAAHQTAAQAMEAAGLPVTISCGAGVCGACRTRVLAGQPDHRDLCLSPEEQAQGDCFAPCCSRAHSDVLVVAL